MSGEDNKTGIESDQGSIQQQLASPESSLVKYQRTVVGDRSLLWLLLFELAVLSFGSVKGKKGLLMRQVAYKHFFKSVGKQFSLGTDCFIRRPHLCSFGSHVQVGDHVSIEVKNNGLGIRLEDAVTVGEFSIFSCPGETLTVGAGTRIGKACRLGSMMGLTIGAQCTIGDYSYIVGAGHSVQYLDRPIIKQPINCKGPNSVGNNVHIGSRVTVLDGITIGDGATIADDTLVTRDIPPGTRVAGVPGKVTG